MTMARPRGFNFDDALDKALTLFWRKGYEGTSLSDLTDAMQIARPSLYAAFGNKESLFHKVLERYEATHLSFVAAALAAASAREVAARFLYGSADCQTGQCLPAGCLAIHAALVCSEASDPIRKALVDRRRAGEAALAKRFAEAKAAGDLPGDEDPEGLARYLMTVAQGMSVQAAAGADRPVLHGIVADAMRNWPSD